MNWLMKLLFHARPTSKADPLQSLDDFDQRRRDWLAEQEIKRLRERAIATERLIRRG